ncbi:MAG: DNA repair protein RecN [Betaproteobacteria bacterium]|nr:DNA repair protein RecN [Betaproteobacteria bacterium]
MLRRVHIRDFVIVDRLDLDFSAGFGALTGETGAGKSILVDALALVLGERADAAVVRHGRERAEIGAEFDVAASGEAVAWLTANDLESEAGGCLLRRVVEAGGRSRGYINGVPATAAQLRELGECLADIHGQNAHHALLRPDTQRAMLDAHAGLSDLARRVVQAHRHWRDARAAWEQATASAAATERERDMLDWQVQELEALAFDPIQWQETVAEHRRCGHAAMLLEASQEALATLDEGELAAGAMVERIAGRLADLCGYDERLREPQQLLEAARIQLDEAVHALRRYSERIDLDPAHLKELEVRVDAVDAMARKHRVPAEELGELLRRLASRRDELAELADPQALAGRMTQAREAYLILARELSAGRAKAAAALGKAVTDAMQGLAMPGARFEVGLDALDEGGAHGLEGVEFRVAANAGQPPRSLARVASGGELSRIGLAIQVITSRSTTTPTLIFDEVDVGIGGRVAEVVGRMLHTLGRERQVLCVTHLPQVAAQADWQWSIAKEGRDGEVLSRVTVLGREQRIEEIARMLGGAQITDTSRRHAREMLGL